MTIPDHVQDTLRRLEAAGHTAHCVGGCVRDTLLGRVPHDWDVTTSALPEAVAALFPRCIPTGLRHGTVTVLTGGGPLEVTTHRKDGAYLDGRRPSAVDFSASLEEDLARRDFTVNAMALDLRGHLTDPFGGREDLAAGLLRCVGDPEARFREDGLRVVRGLRFAAQLGFSLEPETAAATRRCRSLLKKIAAERLEAELSRLLRGPALLPVLLDYPEVLGVMVPELLPTVGFDQRNVHHCYTVWEHSARAAAAVPPDPVLRWAMVLHDIGKPAVFSLGEDGQGHFYGHAQESARLAARGLQRLKMARAPRDAILTLVRWHDYPLDPQPKRIRRALGRFGEETFRRLIAVQRGDNLAQAPAFRDRQARLDAVEAALEAVIAEGQCFSLAQLAVNGRDLADLGLRGRAIGAALQFLLEEVVDGRLPNDRAALLSAVKEREA